MKLKIRTLFGISLFAAILLATSFVSGQQKDQTTPQRLSSYDLSRETVLQGTVVSYTASSPTPPMGAHVTIQTASGAVDVHLGSAKFLEGNHFTLAAGDSVQVVGENLAFADGTVFAARVIQKGSQSLVIRSNRGIPLSRAGARALPAAERAKLAKQGGVQ